MTTESEKLKDCRIYLQGYAAAIAQHQPGVNEKIRRAAEWLQRLERHGVCGQGYIGCNGGPECSSSHK